MFWRRALSRHAAILCSLSVRLACRPALQGAAKPFVAAIGDMPSGDALVGEDAEGGEAEADGDADGVALGSEVADVEEGEEALLD